MSAGCQPLIGPRAVYRQPIEIGSTWRVVAGRSEDDMPSVGCPQWAEAPCRVEGQARQPLAREIPRPDGSRLIKDLERYTLSVRRETSARIRARRRRNR